ncbi:hypothetical protein FB45DRAFT_989751 [Roridomyces roridus]|uniref:Large ribosomal subunit protein mL59 domain-containing protein n=1 Tax=Roridomyces roridus TaxID=1738132 RepID=A0AAD7BWZ0_9AGAR|nr:hypothetical protein FB45DRAFT_989751 [Roridomyces roridus]
MATKFLHGELKALPRFVRRFGPLPAPKAPDAVVLPNPFLPMRNPKTGRWAPPKYSLRRQAELIKTAKAAGTLHLLPPSLKLPKPELFAPSLSTTTRDKGKVVAEKQPSSPAGSSRSAPKIKLSAHRRLRVTVEWDRRPAEKTVPDTGTNLYAARKKMFKGSRLERNKKQREWRTWVLLHDMRKRIRRYRNTYVHRKPNPLKPSRGQAKKLPF